MGPTVVQRGLPPSDSLILSTLGYLFNSSHLLLNYKRNDHKCSFLKMIFEIGGNGIGGDISIAILHLPGLEDNKFEKNNLIEDFKDVLNASCLKSKNRL